MITIIVVGDHHHHLYGDGNSRSIFCNENYCNSCCSPPSTLIDNYLMILIMVTMVPQADDEFGTWVTFPTTW